MEGKRERNAAQELLPATDHSCFPKIEGVAVAAAATKVAAPGEAAK